MVSQSIAARRRVGAQDIIFKNHIGLQCDDIAQIITPETQLDGHLDPSAGKSADGTNRDSRTGVKICGNRGSARDENVLPPLRLQLPESIFLCVLCVLCG